jgi:hypothetical protein
MNDSITAINATLGKDAAAKEKGLEAKVKASMRAVIEGDWMADSEDGLFRAGVGGALLDVGKDSDEGKQILRAVEQIRKFNAWMAAAQAGLSVSTDGLIPEEGAPELLPLMGWWREVKDAAAKHPGLRY